MSQFNFMEKLLDGAGVEWKALGDVGEFIRGNGMQKKDFVEVGFPAIHYGQIYTKYGLSANKTFTFISEGLAKKLRKARENDLLLATTSENDEDVVKPLAWLGDQAAISGDMMLFRHQQNVKYLAYFFKTNVFQEQKRKYITGAKVRRVSSGDLSKIMVPIPCPDNPKKSLEIQAEIVRILDAFTAHTAELNAELNARKRQYNHYRDQLLTFEEGEACLSGRQVEWKTLGEVIATITTGKLNANAMVENGDYPFFTCDSKPFKIDTYAFDTEAIIVSGNGSQVGHINYYKGKFNAYQRTYILSDCNDKFTMGFMLTYLKAHLRPYIMQHSKKGSVPYITMPMLKNFKIPVPSPEEQARIVAILDKFDVLTISISEGLPREIELRQKQYEYYRDLLLSFPKPEAA